MGCQLALLPLLLCACCATPDSTEGIARSRTDDAALAYRLTRADNELLDEIQHATFLYFWREVGEPAMLVRDRYKAHVASVAAIGFQLASLPIGVERGWIGRQEGFDRARTILAHLLGRTDNRRAGVFLHFVDHKTGGLSESGYEVVASTVDHALLVAGAIPAAEYFGGNVKALVTRLIRGTNWQAFATAPDGFLSMGWKPDDPKRMAGPGKLLRPQWHIASDEERLVYLLATGAPRPEHAVAASAYYRLERQVERFDQLPPLVVSANGSLFTYFFSHLWIDYRRLGQDDPSQFGSLAARVDWFENSRRAIRVHRHRCIEQAARLKTLSEHRWGLSPCAGRDGYIVPCVRPNRCRQDRWYDGTVAPYAAVSAILFLPRESIAAIRELRALTDAAGRPLVWRDPRAGGYGFADAFNLDQNYVSDDYVGIDQGPILLAIENARSGLIWKLFMRHPTVVRALERLKLP
jgi:hypothetical protein